MVQLKLKRYCWHTRGSQESLKYIYLYFIITATHKRELSQTNISGSGLNLLSEIHLGNCIQQFSSSFSQVHIDTPTYNHFYTNFLLIGWPQKYSQMRSEEPTLQKPTKNDGICKVALFQVWLTAETIGPWLNVNLFFLLHAQRNVIPFQWFCHPLGTAFLWICVP